MSESIRYEVQTLLMSIMAGCCFMAVYDVIRFWRILVRHDWLLVGIEDVIYWVCITLFTFSLLYRQSDGILRSYTILSVLGAMVVYNRLISKRIVRLLKKLVRWIKIKARKLKNR